MRGLYLNCDYEKIPESVELSRKYSLIYSFSSKLSHAHVIYNKSEWPTPPIFEYEENTFIVSGWFVYKNKRNNIQQLAKDIISNGSKVVGNIEIGVFVIFWTDGNKENVIVDPLGLSSHYIDLQAKQLTVAPSVKVLYQELKHPLNPTLSSILDKKQHLFGNYTLYDGIERLNPGAHYTSDGKASYHVIDTSIIVPISDIGLEFQNLAQYFDKQERILPISSGLDSRFILANIEFESAFTYGPENSPEINIAKGLQSEFENYYSYDFSAPPLYKKEIAINEEMSFGVLEPIDRLLTNYLHIKEKFHDKNVFFDGYCGDVFQRGTFINFKGVFGEILKIFPWLYYLLKWDAKKILRKRNQLLNEEEFSLLFLDFQDKTTNLELDDYQKVTFYEYLYGRGGRYAIYGSNILAAQFFTVVSPFSQRNVLASLLSQNFLDGVNYKIMKRLWKKMPARFKNKKVESGYTPQTPRFFIPFIQIIYRIMFHLIPSRANYGVKMRRVEKQKKKSQKLHK